MAKGGAGKGARKRHKQPRASGASGGGPTAASGRAARRNTAKQQRQHQRQALLATQRELRTTGPPVVVAVVAAGADADAAALCSLLRSHSQRPRTGKSAAEHRLTYVQPARTVEAALGAMKAADVLLLAIPAGGGVDAVGEQLIDAICLQGVGAVVGAITGVDALPERERASARKTWSASLVARFPENARAFSLDLDPSGAALHRHLATVAPKQLAWREAHSYVLAQSHRLLPSAAPSAEPGAADARLLEVVGHVRGEDLCVNRLVHVPGVGDVALERLQILREPRVAAGSAAMETDGVDGAEEVLGELVPSADALMDCRYESEVDGLMGEQTWPTAEEMAEAEEGGRREGKAWAARSEGEEYASGWLRAMHEESDDDEGEEGEEGAAMDAEEGVMGSSAAGAAAEGSDDDAASDAAMEAEAAEAEADEATARRRQLEARTRRDEDARFPDEVDTPLDVAARVRFARFRGLKSFRASPWHPDENLPAEYARIHRFDHWPALQRHARREQRKSASDDTCAPAGAYVRMHLRLPADGAAEFAAEFGSDGRADAAALGAPLVLCSVNTYENRLSVVHFTLGLTAAAEAAELTLRGKAPLVFHVGFRKMVCRPIFSEDNRRCEKHKLERFLHPGRQVVASVYAPALFAPAPLLAFLPPATADAHPSLAGLPVASGALHSVDPDRIILKKVVLTGHPFRCHKHKAVVRWMFFSPEDIRWFKPVELNTKFGRKVRDPPAPRPATPPAGAARSRTARTAQGHIRESLGTHGYMKCIFDGTMVQHDTVRADARARTRRPFRCGGSDALTSPSRRGRRCA